MQAMIDELAKQAAESLGQVSGKETLASFWQEYLSKNGKIPALMKNLRTVAPEERPAMGKIIMLRCGKNWKQSCIVKKMRSLFIRTGMN